MLGAFAPNRFESRTGESAHEIILNPHYLAQREDFESLSTLVHEMAHQWREELGPVGRRRTKGARGYHDLVWAECMERVGLMPSDTGAPDGKRTGPRVSHYVIEGGPFERTARELIASGFVIRWRDIPIAPEGNDPGNDAAAKPKSQKSRVKFSCPDCGQNAWAKTVCGAQMRRLRSRTDIGRKRRRGVMKDHVTRGKVHQMRWPPGGGGPGNVPPVRLPRKKRFDVAAMALPAFAVATGAMVGLSAPRLIDPSGLAGATRIALLTGSAMLVSYIVNRYAVTDGAEHAARGYLSAGITSVASILIVGGGLFASTFAGLTITRVNDLRLQQHGQAAGGVCRGGQRRSVQNPAEQARCRCRGCGHQSACGLRAKRKLSVGPGPRRSGVP